MDMMACTRAGAPAIVQRADAMEVFRATPVCVCMYVCMYVCVFM